MVENKKEMLLSYIEANVGPILVDFIDATKLDNTVIIPANIDRNDLVGHYEDTTYLPPKWLEELINNQDKRVLVIDNIDSIPKEEQLKFCEILEYRKVSTFELPERCIIFVTAKEISKETINEEIFSLVVRI